MTKRQLSYTEMCVRISLLEEKVKRFEDNIKRLNACTGTRVCPKCDGFYSLGYICGNCGHSDYE